MSAGARARSAFRAGAGRVWRARALVGVVWLSTLVVAAPAAVALQAQLAAHLGDSLVGDVVAGGVDFDWWNEFLSQATGLGASFVPAILGFAAVLDNASRIADARPLETTLALLVALQLGVNAWLTGGLLDRLARDARVGVAGFFSACGRWLPATVPLLLVGAICYAALFAWVHPWLFDSVYAAWTRDVTDERVAFGLRMALYGVFAVLVSAVNIWLDYARILAVAGGMPRPFAALGGAALVLRRHPLAAGLLYGANVGLFLLVVAGYAVTAPGAATPVAALVVGQAYIALRAAVRLQFMASQMALALHGTANAG